MQGILHGWHPQTCCLNLGKSATPALPFPFRKIHTGSPTISTATAAATIISSLPAQPLREATGQAKRWERNTEQQRIWRPPFPSFRYTGAPALLFVSSREEESKEEEPVQERWPEQRFTFAYHHLANLDLSACRIAPPQDVESPISKFESPLSICY